MLFPANKKGFGLIELLVVIAVLGLLSSLVVYVSGSYQVRTRDTRRLLDVAQIRQGLELYYTQASGYPETAGWLGGSLFKCQGDNLMKIPQDPSPGLFYVYQAGGKSSKGCGGSQTVWSTYKFQFQTETDTSIGSAGYYCLRPTKGITAGMCP